MFELINQNLSRNPNFFREGFDWKNVDTDPCFKALMVQNLKKVVT